MALIKSHSNYVLKSKHQNVSDGTIWERDITTIGGVNQFSPGQIPIYNSNNFIISIRNEGKVSNQFNKPKWYENTEGNIWTLENVNAMTSPFEDENDIKIVLKQDYYDFNDFAYYGSLSELFRTSITDVLSRFPGELYLSQDNPNVYYKINLSGDVATDYYYKFYANDDNRELLSNETSKKEVSNPFGIDIHSMKLPEGADRLKFFAEDGYKNYEIIDENNNVSEITSWNLTYYYFEYDKETKQYINYTCTPSSISSEYSDTPRPCKGDMAASIKINGTINIEAWIGDFDKIYYLSSDNTSLHIRPKEKFISEFYNNCDNFEKILLNRKTTPLYKATFSVIDEDEVGYHRKLEDFIFPTSYGGFNLDASDYGFNDYTLRLSKIGEYYDEYFTDNLYRSMTHEAIKNFDWTYTREFYEGEEEEYVNGGERIQKALRVFAREFDEIKAYIDNISNYNRITYDERSNVPDYFLTDMVTDCGWDVKLVIPYNLQEVYLDDRSETVDDGDYTLKYQLENSVISRYFRRQFSQASNNEIRPYSADKIPSDIRNGYFVICGDGDVDSSLVSCGYEKSCKGAPLYSIKKADSFTYVDEDCERQESTLKYRVKSFTDERSYTYLEANNEFLRRLKINSPYIWRHKGTIDGIEMILGMFGLKSKRWIESQPKWIKECKYSDTSKTYYDYDIIEYSSFTNRIEEEWDSIHQMYRIDWINSTKTITYDYRTISKYSNTNGNRQYYLSYQGLPVGYRDEYEIHEWDNKCNRVKLYKDSAYTQAYGCDEELDPNNVYTKVINNAYIKIGSIGSQESTNDESEAFKRINENNAPVVRRYLYPQFNKNEQLDGNPYFQMDGGWLSKSIGEGNNVYNFQFDLDDNIVFTRKIKSGYTDDNNVIIDDKPLFKETVRNIRMVDNIRELLTIPKLDLYNGIIVYVENIGKDIAVVGDTVYDIKYEYNRNNQSKPLKYIELVKSNGFINPCKGVFFDDTIVVYDKNRVEVPFVVGLIPEGSILKAYIFEDMEREFMCESSEEGTLVTSFSIITNNEDDTNYFLLENVDYSDTIINERNASWSYGWRRLDIHECDYLKINTIENYYKGNNPHNGNLTYDSGHEYFTYFNRIFKYSQDNNLFDERCFQGNTETNNTVMDYLVNLYQYGFNGLIDNEERIKQYTPFLSSGDTKIRYFGNYKTLDNNIFIYGENQEKTHNDEKKYKNDYDGYTINPYTLKDYKVGFEEMTINLGHKYSCDKHMWEEVEENPITFEKSTNPIIDIQTDEEFSLWNKNLVEQEIINEDIIDGSTNQIVNNKRLSIIFHLKADKWFSREGQEEVKYLDSIVMNYLTQMLPSTVIVDIYYKDNSNNETPIRRTVENYECVAQ